MSLSFRLHKRNLQSLCFGRFEWEAWFNEETIMLHDILVRFLNLCMIKDNASIFDIFGGTDLLALRCSPDP